MSNLDPSDPVVRELRFARPTPRDGEQRRMAGRTFEGFAGEWWERTHADAHREAVEKMLAGLSRADRRRNDLFARWAKMQRERTTDFRGVLPEQYAHEVETRYVTESGAERVERRVDYLGVPIKNADGTLNKSGKALIEAHETQNRRESELAAEIAATPADGG